MYVLALIEFEVHDAVAIIRLNRPDQRNAVTSAMMDEMRHAIARLEGSDEIRVGILTGAGSVFCAGMDLAAFAAGARPGITDPDRFAGFVAAERTKPVIAAVNGGAYAGGFELVLACDMAIASQGARFALPEVKRGLIAAGGGTIRLSRRIPFAVANEMMLSGDPIDAERAYALGLLNAVVPAERLMDAGMDMAMRVATNAPLAVRSSLALSRAAALSAEAELWSHVDAAWAVIDTSEDALEGALAFKEKRAPNWKGR